MIRPPSIGSVFREHRPFPGQDPWVVPHEGALLLVQSAHNDRQIVIKRFSDLSALHRNDVTVIWKPGRDSDHSRQIWAPELHQIGSKWYVYYAASDGWNGNHRMYVLEADRPLGPYREIGRIRDRDHDTWAIDLTVLVQDGRLYAVWSGWESDGDGFPQHLYIAPMSDPVTISGERRRIASPSYDWEMTVAAVNEGPQIVRNPEAAKLFIAYSADASWSEEYKIGLLEWTGGDLAEPASWTKVPRPILLGGGHGCFIETSAGRHLVYHRKMSSDPGWADREIRAEPYEFDLHGYPVLPALRPPADMRTLTPERAEGIAVATLAAPPVAV